MKDKIPYTIIGAGIVGFQTALTLIDKGAKPDHIAIYEQNPFPGEHSSTRNSGVLHAGLYYPKDSLKQELCVKGNRLWRDLEKRFNFDIVACGKYVFASNEEEVPELEQLYNLAKEKDVPGLTWTGTAQIEDYAHVEKAFFSSTTAYLDCGKALKIFSDYLQSKGVHFLYNQKAQPEDVLENSEVVINTGGLYGVEFRKELGLKDIENFFVKGNYLKLNKNFYNESLLYPLPEQNLRGLGIHTVISPDGSILFGPNTEEVSEIDYGMSEEVIDQMFKGISKAFKGIHKNDLMLAYSGIRSKIKIDGAAYQDFVIQSPKPNYIEALGIDSPGFTASPAIAEYIVQELLEDYAPSL